MARTRWVVVSLVVAVALVAAACGGGGGGETFVTLATGGTGGTYYPLGGALAQVWNDQIDGMTATAESTGASVANINLVAEGEVNAAFVQNDISYYAYNGENQFEDGAVESIRAVATMYPEIIQVVTLESTGIASIEDLAGQRVAVGAPGSGTEANARQILAAHGLTYDDIDEQLLSFADAANNMRDGNIDAAFVVAGVPTAAIVDIGATNDVRLVPVERSMVDEMRQEAPFFASVTIPAGSYSGQDAGVDTVAVMAMLIVDEGMDEGTVYDLTQAMFEHQDALVAAHSRAGDITVETAMEGMSIPLHPGAAQYLEEQGVDTGS